MASEASSSEPSASPHEGNKGLPAFLQSSKSDIHHKFVDLEWAQRHRLSQGMLQTEPVSQWARVSGDEVLKRNRYCNIDPYLNNRVKLRVPDGHSDYINASPIALSSSKGETKKTFIATQGPKDTGLGHIWRMIWHETTDIAIIVMLTQTFEAGREKCFQYYPKDMTEKTMQINEHDEFGDSFRATVELEDLTYNDTTRSAVRKMILRVGEETKAVWHYLFVGWPDFLVPEGEDRAALLELIKETDAKNTDPNPRIVHCSAGVGRSGTFIALDYLLTELADGSLDQTDEDIIYETVDALRQQRMMMVQGENQFHFLYNILKEKWLERHGLS